MRRLLIIFLIIFILSLMLFITTLPVRAYSETFGDGWRQTCYDNGKCAYSNYHTIQRYDGQYIPFGSLNISNGQWTYLKTENSTHYILSRMEENLSIPKSFANYAFDLTKISLSFTVTPLQLSSKSIANGSGLWYIPIPDKATKTRFIWDNKKPFVFRNDSQSDFLNDTEYWYSKVNDQIRLNYNQTTRNFGIASTNVTFVFDSWTVGNGGNAWSGNSSYDNFMLDRNTNRIILPDAITSGLVLYHKESGSSGINSYDMNTTSNNNGTLTNMNIGLDNGSSGWNSSGKYGNVIAFDGVNDYVNTPDSASLNITTNLSLEAWIKSSNTGVNGGIVGKDMVGGEDSYLPYKLYQTNLGKITFKLGSGTSFFTITSNTTINANTWYHIVATITGTTMNLYINGVSDATPVTYSGTRQSNTLPVYVGRYYSGGLYFSGAVDEVRIYNRALSNNEINQTMDNIMNTSANPTTWYDSGSGNETYQIDVNFSSIPANTNYTTYYRQNATGSYVQIGTANATANQSITLSTKYRDTDVRVWLFGNTTATPELQSITFWTQTSGGGEVGIAPEVEPVQVWWI